MCEERQSATLQINSFSIVALSLTIGTLGILSALGTINQLISRKEPELFLE